MKRKYYIEERNRRWAVMGRAVTRGMVEVV